MTVILKPLIMCAMLAGSLYGQGPYLPVFTQSITPRYYIEVSVRSMGGIPPAVYAVEGRTIVSHGIRVHVKDYIRLVLRDSMNPGRILPFNSGNKATIECQPSLAPTINIGTVRVKKQGFYQWSFRSLNRCERQPTRSFTISADRIGIFYPPKPAMLSPDLREPRTIEAYNRYVTAFKQEQWIAPQKWYYPDEVIEDMKRSYTPDDIDCDYEFHDPVPFKGFLEFELVFD